MKLPLAEIFSSRLNDAKKKKKKKEREKKKRRAFSCEEEAGPIKNHTVAGCFLINSMPVYISIGSGETAT